MPTDQDIFEYAQIAGDPTADLTKRADLDPNGDVYENPKTQADYAKWDALEQVHRDTVRASILDSKAQMLKGSNRLRELTANWK